MNIMVKARLLSLLLVAMLACSVTDSKAQRHAAYAATQPPIVKRDWGPEQACGPPDTADAGDIPTAWASLTEDGQDEWLLLTYEKAVKPIQILVYETFNPGALYRITAFDRAGRELKLWEGTDPTDPKQDKGVSKVTVKPKFATKKIKLYLKSKEVPGWNEIDAVGLVDQATEKPLWAVSAKASSTYAEPNVNPPSDVEVLRQRVDRLESKVRKLQVEIERLKGQNKTR